MQTDTARWSTPFRCSSIFSIAPISLPFVATGITSVMVKKDAQSDEVYASNSSGLVTCFNNGASEFRACTTVTVIKNPKVEMKATDI